MSKDQLLSELNKINSSASQIGSAADLVGADELAGKIHQVQDKVAKASDAVSTAKNTVNNVKNVVQQGLSSTSIDSLAGTVGSIAGLTGNEKLAANVAKVQQTVSQAKQAVSMAEGVIHRVKSVSNQVSKGLKPISDDTPSAFSSPLELLTALFNRKPSGLQFTLEAGNLPPATFSVISFHFSSHYNELDALDVAVSSADSAINPAQVLDNHAVLSIWQDGVLQQTFSGMVSDFEQGDSGFRLTHYNLTIRPDLWRAGLRRNSRIFQQKDIESILSTLFAENKVMDYAFILRHPHSEREFCVQYRETDYEFLQRLTAEEGIFYYFEHRDGQHRLILTDDVATLVQSVSLPYNLNKNAQLQEKCITSFRRREQLRPSRVQLKDYTFKKPNWAASFESGTGYEHYDFPGRFKDGRGKQYTQYRLDGLRQDAHLGEGISNSPNLQVGKLFTLEGHPKASLNTLWQPVSVRYEGQQPQSSELEAGGNPTTLTANFEFIPSDQTWRPSQRTKPRIEGPQMAIVTGPKGEEIYTDNFGRIRLQFLWDREGKFDDHSSCWVRVTQPWAGKGWGMMAIPRVGHEVVVNFLDGDPDQPIVTGRAYHANNMSPAGLPANKTQMHIMSQTYKGGGYNGVMMEDSPGAQRLDFQAQKDMTTDVINNKSMLVINEHAESVTKNQDITVRGNRDKHVLEAELVSLSQNSINQVGINQSLTAEKTLIVSSQGGGIALVAGGASISLDKEGSVMIAGSGTVTINGQESVYINNGMVNNNIVAIMLALLSPDLTPEQLAEAWQAASSEIERLHQEGKHELANELDRQRKALQKAALAKAVYNPVGSEPPVGWKEISDNPEELSKYGLITKDFPKNQDFQARFFVPDPAVFGDDMKPSIVFRGTRPEELVDWKNNFRQGVGLKSDYYERALAIGQKIKDSGNAANVEFVGHSLGGGLASAASRVSGAKATIFNSAGLNDSTVKNVVPSEIEAYYVKGEILTRFQEFDGVSFSSAPINNVGDYLLAKGMPDAVYTTRYPLPKQTTEHWILPIRNSVDDHGMDKVIPALEGEFRGIIGSIR
ncbi:type VI secretion system tip protein TssI/VgrG [Aggregatibacter kilianii]|uniref:type VI secretion system tip protein TssI/VgrG n=1 Tax=Aggregatibacter kilianii TaxID=2025884 RepID=UPI000D65D761|nr:type VI secretion system tip protein TssI/VgrG [Aggregatibacter kilianii]